MQHSETYKPGSGKKYETIYLTDGEWAAGVFPFINNFTRNEKEKRIKGSSDYFEQFLNKLVIF